jgi:hypothetical protein
VTDAGDQETDEPYVAPTGDPIVADDLTWSFIDFPDSRCRDGSSTGIGISPNSASTKVMIYLQGGGACYNALTCMTNASSFSGAGYNGESGGVFDRDNPDNPVGDWSHVFVPFCTGDVHGGNSVADPGIGAEQQYHGYRNIQIFLDRIVPTFPDVDQVLLTGGSAGGFGAALTANLVGSAFPPGTTLTLVNDSGPPMSSDYLPTCLQQQWRELWSFDSTFLADCGAACPDPNDYAVDWPLFLAGKYTDSNAALISSVADSVITMFYGFGVNDCNPPLIPSMPAADFEAGLMDFRATMQSVPNFGTYYISGSTHTWIAADRFYDTTADGVRLVDWFRDIVEGNPPTHVGP